MKRVLIALAVVRDIRRKYFCRHPALRKNVKERRMRSKQMRDNRKSL